MENYFSIKSFMETDFRANILVSTSRNVVNERILFPLDKNLDSTIQNEGFVKKMRFHYAKKPLSPAGTSKKARIKWFSIVGERLLYKKWLHLNLNNGLH